MSEAEMNPVPLDIVTAFTDADYDRIPELVRKGLEAGLQPDVLLDSGLVAGIREVGEMFRRGEAYLPEMMLAAEAWQAGMDILEPLVAQTSSTHSKGKIVIGTVKGDVHSLGKNMVITLLKTAGFEVVDMGIDVPASTFVSAAIDSHADIIAACALMTTTMTQQRDVIEHLVAANRRQDFFVMVGGAATSAEWARQIDADGYGETAADAVALAERYCQGLQRS